MACIDVLKVLATKGPSKRTRIAFASNLNFDVLTEYLDFLIKQDAVEERTFGNTSAVFAITQHGINLLKYFGQLNELPLIQKEK
jgi:predicted transcriptional regulator